MLTLKNLAILQSHPFYVYSWNEDGLVDLLVERKSGFTKSLFDENALKVDGKAVRAMIEGPFGKSVDLTPYKTIILFATGIGIVAQLSHVRRWVMDQQSPFDPTTTGINLFWEVETKG
jgi:predicted ferric reductase